MIGSVTLQRKPSSISAIRWHLFLALVFAVAAGELFFSTYRVVYFGSVSYDDYSQYLLFLLGDDVGRVPPSPHVYRIGSVVLALPFYSIPFIPLSDGAGSPHLPATVQDAKALAAMCAANVFYLTLTALMVYAYLLRRIGTSPLWAFAGAAAVILMGNQLSLEGNDGISVFPLTAALFLAAERKWKWFLLTVFLGAFINEKIIIISLLVVGCRALSTMSFRSQETKATVGLLAIFIGFLIVITLFPFPGVNDNQRQVGQFLSSALSTISKSTTIKGLYLNIWPLAVLVTIWGIAVSHRVPGQILHRIDILALLTFFLLVAMLNVQFNIGRLVTYFMPFFVAGCVQALAMCDRDQTDLSPGKG